MGRKGLIGDGSNLALAAAIITLLVLASAFVLLDLNRNQPLGIDFAPVWAAATNPDHAYDVQAVTRLQSDVLARDLAARPFAYPPTTLLLLLPFGFLGFWYAYAAFIAFSSALFVLALRSSSVSLWAMVFPPIVILLHVGQITLLAGSLLLLALASSNWTYRGVLFAIAVALKPQLTIFVPALLLLQRDWRSVALTFVVLSLIVAGSIAAFGLGLWQEWSQSLRDLVQIVNANPSLAAHQISSSWFFLPLSLIAVWLARKADAATQLGLVVGAALLILPYAMNYELALLVPAVARKGFQEDRPTALAASILGMWFLLFLLPVLLITLGFLIWRTWVTIGAEVDGANPVELNSMPAQ
jgi:hypothetical protein